MHQSFLFELRNIACLIAILLAPSSYAYAYDWVNTGWNHLEQNQREQALIDWQTGVNTLDNQQLLIMLSLSRNFDSAIHFAKKAGRKESAFIVKSTFQNQPAYYILSARLASLNPRIRHQELTSLRQAIGVTEKLYSNAAIKFKSRQLASRQLAPTQAASTTIHIDQVREMDHALDVDLQFEKKPFLITSFQFTGNTLIPEKELQLALKPFIGLAKTADNLALVGKVLNATYQSHSYALKNIKHRNKNDGIMTLALVEYPEIIHKVKAVKAVPSLTSFQPPRVNTAPHSVTKKTAQITNPKFKWLMHGNKTLKQNLNSLLQQHQWTLIWEADHDFQSGIDVMLHGTLSSIIDHIIAAYGNRGILLKATWFEGNHVLLIQRIFSISELNEVPQ